MMIIFFIDCLCQHCLLIHMNRCLKNTEYFRKEFVINHIKKIPQQGGVYQLSLEADVWLC
jgi:hypothetical protein